MYHKGLKNGVETGLYRGTQLLEALDGLYGFLCLVGAGSLYIFKLFRLAGQVEITDSGTVQNGIGLVGTDVLQMDVLDAACVAKVWRRS